MQLGSLELTPEDMQVMRKPHSWWEDVHIDGFGRQLERSTDMGYIPSHVLHDVLQGGAHARHMLRNSMPKNAKRLAGALNVGRAHWAALLVDASMRRAFIVDTVKQDALQSQQTLQNVQHFLQEIGLHVSVSEDTQFHGLQRDAHSCGPMVCSIMEQFAHRVPLQHLAEQLQHDYDRTVQQLRQNIADAMPTPAPTEASAV